MTTKGLLTTKLANAIVTLIEDTGADQAEAKTALQMAQLLIYGSEKVKHFVERAEGLVTLSEASSMANSID